MNLKTLSISVLILAILSGIVAWLNRPTVATDTDPRVGQSLLADIAANDTDALTITRDGETVELKQDDQQNWRVTSYHDLPADASKLRRLVQDLAEANIVRVVTHNPDRAARLELGESSVAFASNGGTSTITFGKNAQRGGRYLKFDDAADAPVSLTAATTFLDTTAKNWANAELTGFEADDIKQLEIEFAAGEQITVTRDDADADWQAPGLDDDLRLRSASVSSLLNQLSSLRFTETAAPDAADVVAASENQSTFRLTTFADETLTIAMGRKPEQTMVKEDAADPVAAVADLTSSPEIAPDGADEALEDMTETIPAGPVYVSFEGPTALAPLAEAQSKLAFQIADYIFTGLPTERAGLTENAPPPPPPAVSTE
jgi:hypothetical protein